MGLFTNPVVLTDGVDATRNFYFRAQRADAKSVVGDYIEDSSQPIAAESVLVVKHDVRKVPRHLLQRTINRRPAAVAATEPLSKITMNFTVTADKAFTPAELQTELNILIDAISKEYFLTNMLSGMI